MSFNLAHFGKFCASLKITDKETGLVPLKLLGTQRYFIDQVAAGLKDDIHKFVVLKGRQQGISTLMLALDLYWFMKNHHTSGAIVVHEDASRETFRSTISQYHEGLDKSFKVPIRAHNRNLLEFENNSRVLYQVAGTKKKASGIGRSTSVSFIHATECAFWGDEAALQALNDTAAQHNPNRLYVFESTANGYGLYYDMVEEAKHAVSQKFIFVGWWLNERYFFDEGSRIYQVYWDGTLSPEERRWTREVKELYGHEITPGQMAWWRWMVEEEKGGDMVSMLQEHPPTEEHAFQLSGQRFFSGEKLSDEYKRCKKEKFHCFRYYMGREFEQTELKVTNPQHAELKIWEFPREGAVYVIGGDPAYGSSDWADRFAIQVFRCFSDGMEQVAEYCTAEINTFQYAWVVSHLAGAYKGAMVNIEINGPGQAVFAELQNMRRRASSPNAAPQGLMDVVGNVRWYIYRRLDSTSGGYGPYHTITTQTVKERYMNMFRDMFERDTLILNSEECLLEMKDIVRQDGVIEAPGRRKDDRAVSCGLAVMAYTQSIYPALIGMQGHRRAESKSRDDSTAEEQAVNRSVMDYLRQIGVVKKEGQT